MRKASRSYTTYLLWTTITPFDIFKPSVNMRGLGTCLSNTRVDCHITKLYGRAHGTRQYVHSSNYWKEGQEKPKMIAYTIVASPYVKVTQRIELRPLNPSWDIGITIVEDTAISTTYNLRLLFNPSYTVPTIDPTLTGTICRRCGTCPLQTSPHYRFQTQLVHDRWEYLLPLPVVRVVWI